MREGINNAFNELKHQYEVREEKYIEREETAIKALKKIEEEMNALKKSSQPNQDKNMDTKVVKDAYQNTNKTYAGIAATKEPNIEPTARTKIHYVSDPVSINVDLDKISSEKIPMLCP